MSRLLGDPTAAGFPTGREVPHRAADAAGAARVVQVGGLHDVADRLRADGPPLLRRSDPVPWIRAAPASGVGARPRERRHPGGRLARVRHALPDHRRQRACARDLDRAPRRRHRRHLRSALQPARRVHPGRRDARDVDGGERVLRHHPRAARPRRRNGGRARTRCRSGHPRQATLGAQQLPDPAGPVRDDQPALPVHLRPRQLVGRPARAHGPRRRRAARVQRAAPGSRRAA